MDQTKVKSILIEGSPKKTNDGMGRVSLLYRLRSNATISMLYFFNSMEFLDDQSVRFTRSPMAKKPSIQTTLLYQPNGYFLMSDNDGVVARRL